MQGGAVNLLTGVSFCMRNVEYFDFFVPKRMLLYCKMFFQHYFVILIYTGAFQPGWRHQTAILNIIKFYIEVKYGT